jgi:hypothetical protein
MERKNLWQHLNELEKAVKALDVPSVGYAQIPYDDVEDYKVHFWGTCTQLNMDVKYIILIDHDIQCQGVKFQRKYCLKYSQIVLMCLSTVFCPLLSESLPGYIKGIKLQPDHQNSKQFARPP